MLYKLIIITLNDTVKTNVLRFRNNNFSYDIQRHLSNYQAYDKLSGNKDW
jgi:hypothetical protein